MLNLPACLSGDAVLDFFLGIRLSLLLQNQGVQSFGVYAGANHQVDEPDLLAFIGDLSLGWLSVQPKGEGAGHTYNRKQNEPAQNRSGWPARPFQIIGMMEEHCERVAYGYRQGMNFARRLNNILLDVLAYSLEPSPRLERIRHT